MKQPKKMVTRPRHSKKIAQKKKANTTSGQQEEQAWLYQLRADLGYCRRRGQGCKDWRREGKYKERQKGTTAGS